MMSKELAEELGANHKDDISWLTKDLSHQSQMRIKTEKELDKIHLAISNIMFYSYDWERKEIITALKEQIETLEKNG